MEVSAHPIQPTLPFDFDRAVEPAVVQLHKLQGRGYNVFSAFAEIAKQNYDSMVRFGGRDPVRLGDYVFDLNNPDDCYALAQKICTEGRYNSNAYQAAFDIPVFIITPIPVLYNRHNLQDVMGVADIHFKACRAQGEKGEKTIVPILENSTVRGFQNFKNSGQQVAALYSASIAQELEQDIFHLKFQTDVGEMTRFLKAVPSECSPVYQ